ncbi:MAG: hypothetical protein Q7W13_00475 [Bacteroidia bacterium]|nr:hypothetical protein [Bacteroidia bacterium]
MKKALIAVFSISLTAGTLYLTYSQVKDYFIKKLVKSWIEESKKLNKELSEEQIKSLKEELDKLYLWEVKLLAKYSEKAIQRVPEQELEPIIAKLKEKKILERADLKSVDAILFGT